MPYIIQNGFDERHAYIGGMFGAGELLLALEYSVYTVFSEDSLFLSL